MTLSVALREGLTQNAGIITTAQANSIGISKIMGRTPNGESRKDAIWEE